MRQMSTWTSPGYCAAPRPRPTSGKSSAVPPQQRVKAEDLTQQSPMSQQSGNPLLSGPIASKLPLRNETGPLGQLALSRATVDRAATLRADIEWIEQAWADPKTRVLVVHDARALVRTSGDHA